MARLLSILIPFLMLCACGRVDAPEHSINCWDTNGDNIHDPEEDINDDGIWNARDCQGEDGLSGGNGIHCWDLNENGSCETGTEDTDSDGVCAVDDCTGPPGTFSGVFDGPSTFDDSVEFNGRTSFTNGFNLPGRVIRGPTLTGTVFATETVSNESNVCEATAPGYHPCTAWEAMVIDTLSMDEVFDAQGWVVGSFPNLDSHMRSLTNGQDSIVCPAGSYLTKYPSRFTHGAVTTAGGLHCRLDSVALPVWCCADRWSGG